MPITFVQQGVIGQFLAAILMMLGSDGLLEVSAPMTDDERRDQEVHIRGLFGLGLALQIKTSTYLHLQPKALHPLLQVQHPNHNKQYHLMLLVHKHPYLYCNDLIQNVITMQI